MAEPMQGALDVADSRGRGPTKHDLECLRCGKTWHQWSYPPHQPLKPYRVCSDCAAKRWLAEQRQKSWQALRREIRASLH